MFRQHWFIIKTIIVLPINIIFLLYKWNYLKSPFILISAPVTLRKGVEDVGSQISSLLTILKFNFGPFTSQ